MFSSITGIQWCFLFRVSISIDFYYVMFHEYSQSFLEYCIDCAITWCNLDQIDRIYTTLVKTLNQCVLRNKMRIYLGRSCYCVRSILYSWKLWEPGIFAQPYQTWEHRRGAKRTRNPRGIRARSQTRPKKSKIRNIRSYQLECIIAKHKNICTALQPQRSPPRLSL